MSIAASKVTQHRNYMGMPSHLFITRVAFSDWGAGLRASGSGLRFVFLEKLQGFSLHLGD